MIDRVLLVSIALVAGIAAARAPLAAGLAAVAIALLLGRKLDRATLVLAAIALLVGTWRARAALDSASTLHARVVAAIGAPSRCEGEAVVIGSPVVLRGGAPAGSDGDGAGQARIEVEILDGVCGDRALGMPIRARLHGAPEDLGRGDRIALVADLAPVHLFLNEDLSDPRPGIARAGVAASGGVVDVRLRSRGRSVGAWIDRARAYVRRRIEATYHPEAEELGRALVLGETDLPEDDDLAFRRAGLSHILAVSGTHLVLAVAGFGALVRALLLRIEALSARFDVGRASAALCIPAAWLYADFAGGSGSALRAAGMLSATMLARAAGRRPSGLRAFGGSLFVAALVDPLVGSDLSFMLSAGATAGLLALDRPIAGAIVRGPLPVRALLRPTATTLAAMIGCLPFTALVSPELPVLGLLANLLAAPIGELAALPLCLGHAVLGWAPPVEKGAALLGSGALIAVRAVARAASTMGGTLLLPPPSAAQLAAVAVTAVAVAVADRRAARVVSLLLGAAAVLVLEGASLHAARAPGPLRIHALDVGQGDALLVDLPEGGAMLIDGGGFVGSPVDPGLRVVLPKLRARRTRRLDVVVLSHPHPDHFTGLVSTVPAVEVGELWDTGQGEALGAGPAYASLLAGARQRGIPVRRPDTLCGEHRIGGARVEVLAPCPAFAPDGSANDNSFVLRISHGRRSALLVGDAEHEAEQALVDRNPAALRADLLKVGHHGSRTSSTPAFLAAVAPSIALISCGVRNRYGHPDPGVERALASRGITVARTDRGGEIVWETDGEEVRLYRPAAR